MYLNLTLLCWCYDITVFQNYDISIHQKLSFCHLFKICPQDHKAHLAADELTTVRRNLINQNVDVDGELVRANLSAGVRWLKCVLRAGEWKKTCRKRKCVLILYLHLCIHVLLNWIFTSMYLFCDLDSSLLYTFRDLESSLPYTYSVILSFYFRYGKHGIMCIVVTSTRRHSSRPWTARKVSTITSEDFKTRRSVLDYIWGRRLVSEFCMLIE